MRLRAGQCRARHTGNSGLARASCNSAHCALHRTQPGTIQRFLAHLMCARHLWRERRDTRADHLILRNKGLSLSAELHLIGTAVTYKHVERLPHPPTPLAVRQEGRRPRRPSRFLASAPGFPHPDGGIKSSRRIVCVQRQICGGLAKIFYVANRPLCF